jgi:hypothetical protein
MAGRGAETGTSRVASGLGDLLRRQSTTVVALVVALVVLAVVGAGAVLVFTDPGDENETRQPDDNGTDPSDDSGTDRSGNDDGTDPSDDSGTDPPDDGNGTDPPEVTLGIDLTADSVTVSHESGATVDTADLRVVFTVDGEESERGLLSFDDRPGDPERFAPGEAFVAGGAYTGNVTVSVVHDPTGTRLATESAVFTPALNLTVEAITNGDGGDLFVGDEVAVAFALEAPDAPVESPVTVRLDGQVVFEETVTVEAGATVTETVAGVADLGDGLDVVVETDRGSATETLAGPSLDVALDGDPDTSPTEFAYTVENTGDIGAEGSVTLVSTAANGSTLGERERIERVAGGETATGTFAAVDVGAGGTLTLSSPDDTASVAVGESEFQVVGFDAPEEVAAGESVVVAYEVENAGTFLDTQTITFTVNGVQQDTESNVTLAGGETVSDTFTYEVSAEAGPDLAVGVSTGDDTAETVLAVAVPAAANFTVDIVDTTTTVTAGGALAVTADVTNAGEGSGTQTVTLDVPGLGTQTTEVTLDGGESTVVTLELATATGDVGTYNATVSTDGDEAGVEAEVLEGGKDAPAVFEVVGFDTPTVVEAGGELAVTYEIENTGDGKGTQSVVFLVNGDEVETAADVTLGAGETFNGTFTHGATGGDAGETVTVAVSTGNDTAESGVDVVAGSTPGVDLVASLSTETGDVGDTVSVELDVVSADSSPDEFGSYVLVLSYDDSILSFEGISGGALGVPASTNGGDGMVVTTDFSPSGETPATPALTFEFEILAEGTSPVAFDAQGTANENGINDGDANPYDVQFEGGAAGTP